MLSLAACRFSTTAASRPTTAPCVESRVTGKCWALTSRAAYGGNGLVGFAVFHRLPSSDEVQRFLDRAIRVAGQPPEYMITDKGKQFWCRGFKRWCKRRGIRPRYGAVGQPASIAIVERFIRSMKQECTRLLLVPMSLVSMRRELASYSTWYNGHRPHMALNGNAPREVYLAHVARRRQFEPRTGWRPVGRHGAGGDRFRLAVSYVEGRRHLPIVELRRAA